MSEELKNMYRVIVIIPPKEAGMGAQIRTEGWLRSPNEASQLVRKEAQTLGVGALVGMICPDGTLTLQSGMAGQKA